MEFSISDREVQSISMYFTRIIRILLAFLTEDLGSVQGMHRGRYCNLSEYVFCHIGKTDDSWRFVLITSCQQTMQSTRDIPWSSRFCWRFQMPHESSSPLRRRKFQISSIKVTYSFNEGSRLFRLVLPIMMKFPNVSEDLGCFFCQTPLQLSAKTSYVRN